MTTNPWKTDPDCLEVGRRLNAAALVFDQTCAKRIGAARRSMGPLVGIFGSAREPTVAPIVGQYYDLAGKLGTTLGHEGYGLLTGHCPGFAERVEDSFRVSRVNVRRQPIIGVRIEMKAPDGVVFEPTDPDKVDIYVGNRRFGTRIEVMAEFAAAGVFFPGGIGTFLELALYLQQSQLHRYLGHLSGPLRVILVGNGFWKPLYDMLDMMVQAGTLSANELDALEIVQADSVEQILAGLRGYADYELQARRVVTAA